MSRVTRELTSHIGIDCFRRRPGFSEPCALKRILLGLNPYIVLSEARMTTWKQSGFRLIKLLGAILSVAAALLAPRAFAGGLDAELVIYNGKILTADSPDP